MKLEKYIWAVVDQMWFDPAVFFFLCRAWELYWVEIVRIRTINALRVANSISTKMCRGTPSEKKEGLKKMWHEFGCNKAIHHGTLQMDPQHQLTGVSSEETFTLKSHTCVSLRMTGIV